MCETIILIAVENKGDLEMLLHSSRMEHENCGGGEITTQWEQDDYHITGQLRLVCKKCKRSFLLGITRDVSLSGVINTEMVNLLTKKITSFSYYSELYFIWKEELEARKEFREEEREKEKMIIRWIKIIALSLLAIFIVATIIFFH